MTEIEMLDESDADRIAALLVGRRIIAVEEGTFARPPGWSTYPVAKGLMLLDDGTEILVAPNDGCGGCSSGWYDLTSLAATDNVITSVRTAAEPHPDRPGDKDSHSYRIYVVADAVEINAVRVDGDDGNGYYGTGYALLVVVPDASEKGAGGA